LVGLVESLKMHELLWVEEIFIVDKISNDIFDIPDEISENADVCTKFLFADVEVGLVLVSQVLNVFSSLVDVVAHKRSTGSKSAPSASRLAPSRIYMFSSAR
jgi:hypothetical protein